MKRLFSLIFISILILSGCSSSASTEDIVDSTYHIKVAFASSESHPQYAALEHISDELYEKTDGRYDLDIKANAILGDQASTIQMTSQGAIDMAVVAGSEIETYDSAFAIFSLPYTYESLDHQEAAYTSDIFDELYTQTEQFGFKICAPFTAGARSFYTAKPIEKQEDLSGQKIRVQSSALMIEMMKALGGSPTAMSQSDVYTSIQQGVVDGAENNEVTYVDQKHYEVAPYFTYTEHLMQPDFVIVGTTFYDSLTDEDKKIFDEVMDEAVYYEFDLWREATVEAIQTAKDGGAIFSQIDKTPFIESVKELDEKYINESEQSKEIWNEIQALAEDGGSNGSN